MEFHLLQILVVVANIQVKLLKTEAETGFMRTAIDHELVDPKVKTNLEKREQAKAIKIESLIPKGNKFNITWLWIG